MCNGNCKFGFGYGVNGDEELCVLEDFFDDVDVDIY